MQEHFKVKRNYTNDLTKHFLFLWIVGYLQQCEVQIYEHARAYHDLRWDRVHSSCILWKYLVAIRSSDISTTCSIYPAKP